jgi:outer membrane immunogenic protein
MLPMSGRGEGRVKMSFLPRFVSVTVLVASTVMIESQARAADFETPVMPDASYDWQGTYLGLAVAGVGSGIDVRGIGSKNKLDLKDKTFGMAAIAGYNFTSGPWVWGVEGQFVRNGFKKTGAIAGLGNVSVRSTYATSLALRGGYAFDNLLLYGKVGAALTGIKISSSLGGSSNKTVLGAVYGIGAEYAVNESWAVRAELLGQGFRTKPVLAGTKQKIDFGNATVQVGMTFKF